MPPSTEKSTPSLPSANAAAQVAASNQTLNAFLGTSATPSWMTGGLPPITPNSAHRPQVIRSSVLPRHRLRQQTEAAKDHSSDTHGLDTLSQKQSQSRDDSVLPSPALTNERSPSLSTRHASPTDLTGEIQSTTEAPVTRQTRASPSVPDTMPEPNASAAPILPDDEVQFLRQGSVGGRQPSETAQTDSSAASGSASKKKRVAETPPVTAQQPKRPRLLLPLAPATQDRPNDTPKEWFQLFEQQCRQIGGWDSLRGGVAVHRYRYLNRAMQQNDIFYICLHQLFCLWTEHRDYVHQVFPQMTTNVVDGAFQTLSQVLRQNSEMSQEHRAWFCSFPFPIQKTEHPSVERVRPGIGEFLTSLSLKWASSIATANQRRYPLTAAELLHDLKCRSGTLQFTLFTVSRRMLLVPDQFAKPLDEVFENAQNAEGRIEVDGIHPHAALQTRNQFAAQFQSLTADILRRSRANVNPMPPSNRPQTTPASADPRQQPNVLPVHPRPGNSTPVNQSPTVLPSNAVIVNNSVLPNQTFTYPNRPGSAMSVATSSQAPISPVGHSPQPQVTSPYGQPNQANYSLPAQQQPSAGAAHQTLNGFAQQSFQSPTQQHFQGSAQPQPFQGHPQQPPRGHPQQPFQGRAQQQFQGYTQQQFQGPAQPHFQGPPQYPNQYIQHPQHPQHPQQAQQPQQPPMPQGSPMDPRVWSYRPSPYHVNSALSYAQAGSPYAHQQQVTAPHSNQNALSRTHNQSPVNIPQQPTAAGTSLPPNAAPRADSVGYVPSTRPIRRIPENEYPVSQYDWTCVAASAHLPHLHSPFRRPAMLTGSRYYQYVSAFAVEPIHVPQRLGLSTLTFNLQKGDIAMISRSTKDELSGRLFSHYFENSRRYRLRLCKRPATETTISEADWIVAPCHWPEQIYISINDKPVMLRRKQHFHNDLPMELSDLVVEGENTVTISLPPSPSGASQTLHFFLAVEVVLTASHETLLQSIHDSQHTTMEETEREISRRLLPPDSDDVVAEDNSLCISIADPFSFSIFKVPVRGLHCRHLECFDLETWLLTRRCKPKASKTNELARLEPSLVDGWKCPICDGDARPGSLRIDDYFVKVRNDLVVNKRESTKRIRVVSSGNWTPIAEPDDSDDEGNDLPQAGPRPVAPRSTAKPNLADVVEIIDD